MARHGNTNVFLLFLGKNTDVLFAFLAAVSKHLTRNCEEALLWLKLKEGYNPVWKGRHGGRNVNQLITLLPPS